MSAINLEPLERLYGIFKDSPAPTTLTVIGVLLLLIAVAGIVQALRKEPPAWLKWVIFVTLVFGIILSTTGPSLTLLRLTEPTAPRTISEQAFANLKENKYTSHLVRLIAFDPATQSHLAVTQLKKLGPEQHLYSFVAPYDELKGLNAAEAIRLVGGHRMDKDQRLSAIVFGLPSAGVSILYPANARGLLQVIGEVERNVPVERPFLKNNPALDIGDWNDLGSTDIKSWQWDRYADRYPKYCKLAHEFRCPASRQQYSARAHIGDISDDWHPLGFSQTEWTNPCNVSVDDYCSKASWETWRQKVLASGNAKFGSRIFLIKNLDLNRLPKRYSIDFGEPMGQVIPDVSPELLKR